MKLSNFDYHLPPELIAQTPAEPRDSSKLLCLERHTGHIQDKVFLDIVDMLGENDVLVVNQTHVINARLKGTIMKSPSMREISEGQREHKCEVFLHKKKDESLWDCLVYPGKKLKPGTKIVFPEGLSAQIKEISEKGRIVEFSLGGEDFLRVVDIIGETPLPPYIKDHSSPSERYQTVYHDKTKSGSVAAPTAGLHFTPELMETLRKKGVIIEKVLLHVGLGTFANVEVDNIYDHNMHSEYIEIDADTSLKLNEYKRIGKRIIAVGTTSVRTLESFANEDNTLEHGSKETEIFIYPGYKWKFVDSIITNFHLPKSTLLMLVSSFAGDENRKRAYQHAVDSQYRFFSFGDAMWIY